jgi:hypothetical protein
MALMEIGNLLVLEKFRTAYRLSQKLWDTLKKNFDISHLMNIPQAT